MDDNLTGVLIVVASIMGVICLRFLKLKMRDRPALNAKESATMEQMTQTALHLEQRVAVLEQILDAELPAWRSDPANIIRRAS